MRPDPQGRIDTDALGAKVHRFGEDLGREDTVFDDLLIVVEVVDEEVQGLHALTQPGIHTLPL